MQLGALTTRLKCISEKAKISKRSSLNEPIDTDKDKSITFEDIFKDNHNVCKG